MKVSKLIIPLLGLTSINNANKQELLQLEKLPEISYEVSMKDNWDSYYYLTDTNTTENVVSSQKDKGGNNFPGGLNCSDILDAANACWDDWNKFRALACYTSAMALYAACIAATSV